jgi:hypothetical protein
MRAERWLRDPFVGGLALSLIVGGALYGMAARRAGSLPATVLPAELLSHLDSVVPPLRIGAADAPVQVIEVGDYECPGCFQSYVENREWLTSAVERGTISFAFYDLPLTAHSRGRLAGTAVRCVAEGDPDAAWDLHDALLDRREEWLEAEVVEAAVLRIVGEADLRPDLVESCWADRRREVFGHHQQAWAIARGHGLTFIPLWAVDGRIVRWDRVARRVRTAVNAAGS